MKTSDEKPPLVAYTMNVLEDVTFVVLKSLNSPTDGGVVCLTKPRVLLVRAKWPDFDGLAVMKVWHWHDTSNHPLVAAVRRHFDKEDRAYGRLMDSGLCDLGVAPICYGKWRFPKDWSKRFLGDNQHDGNKLLAPFLQEHPPMAMFIEYMRRSKPLNDFGRHFNDAFIDEAIHRYRRIHEAGVYQFEYDVRNILVTPSGLPIIIDFYASFSLPTDDVSEESFEYEIDRIRELLVAFRNGEDVKQLTDDDSSNGTDIPEVGSVISAPAAISRKPDASIVIPLLILGGGIPAFQLAVKVVPLVVNAVVQWSTTGSLS